MDAISFITSILGVVVVGSSGVFLSLYQHLILVANGGILGGFVLRERDVIRRFR